MKVPKKATKKSIKEASYNHCGGRPRIYTSDLLENLAKSLIDWVAQNSVSGNQFLLGDWCFSVGFNGKYFKRYADQNENFKEAYEWAKQWQEHRIAKGALNNTLNARFSQFFLGCNHNWSTFEAVENEEEKAKSRLEEIRDQLHLLQKKIDR